MKPANRRQVGLGLVTLLAFGALAAVGQDAAHAQATPDPDYWKQTAERRNTVYRFVYSQSPQTIPTSYDAVAEAERITLREAQRTLPPSDPQARSIWERIRALTGKTRVSPAVRVLGTIGLAVATFDLGWKIGTGVNAKFLRVGIPGNGEIPASYSQPQISFRQAGEKSQLWYKVPVPQDAWVWSVHSSAFSYQRSFEFRPTVSNGECQAQAFTPPSGFSVTSAPAEAFSCYHNPSLADVIDLLTAYIPEDALGASGPIEPYTDQPYTRSTSAPTPPAQATVEQAVDDELDKPENGVLRKWVNFRLGSPGEQDPTSGSVNMPDCAGLTVGDCTANLTSLGITDYQVETLPESNLSFANGEVVTTDPEPGTSVDPATVTITIAANPATRVKSEEDQRCDRDTYGAPTDPGPAPANGSAYPQYQAAPTPWSGPYVGSDPATIPPQTVGLLMRYGVQPGNINKGWGWRHIKAKHGYGTSEMSETERALVTDPVPTMMFASTRQYAFHYYYEMPSGSATIWCVRTVLAEFEPDKRQLEMGDTTPKGVVNSYTGLLLGAQ